MMSSEPTVWDGDKAIYHCRWQNGKVLSPPCGMETRKAESELITSSLF